MSGMTFEKASEILDCRKACANKRIECTHDAIMAVTALMFLEGHASRDAEVERLKAELEAEKRRTAAYRKLAIYYSAYAKLNWRYWSTLPALENLEDAEAPVDAEAQDILAKSGGEGKA